MGFVGKKLFGVTKSLGVKKLFDVKKVLV